MRHIIILMEMVVILVVGAGCENKGRKEVGPSHVPAWGDDDYSVLPLIKDTPSIVRMNRLTSNGCIMSTLLPADKSYYEIEVGENMGTHCTRWFDLKVMRDGKVYRMITDPESLEFVWVPDTWAIANGQGQLQPTKKGGK